MTFHLWIWLRRLTSEPAACPLLPSATGEQNVIRDNSFLTTQEKCLLPLHSIALNLSIPQY